MKSKQGWALSPFYFRKEIRNLSSLTPLIFVLCLIGSVHAEPIQKEKNIMTTELLEQRGKQLRTEVMQIWNNLKHSKSLRMTNDISDAVAKFIPVGTSFDDTEVILRSAGFGIWQPKESDNCDLGAGMVIEAAGVYMSEVTVLIWSKKQNVSPNVVGRVTASLSYTSL